jgi:fermentation-respiration switch protein FrsA (DUF1100 family)
VAQREDIRFASGDGHCAGWLYSAPRGSKLAGEAGVPCVVLAHGFAAHKEARLDAYAERFVERGMAALVFDYRHFGDSSGEPRRLVNIGRQHEDWQAAVEKARSLEGIDPERIALWGSSNSGGHVVWVAARDDRVAVVVAQVPHADGIATIRNLEPVRAAKLTAAGVQDRAASLLGRVHNMAIVGPPGSTATMTGNDAATLYPGMYPEDYEFVNETPARIMLTYATYSPGRDASKVNCPILVVVGRDDEITPPDPARKIAEKAHQGTLLEFDGGHFDIYRGDVFEATVREEANFLEAGLQARAA